MLTVANAQLLLFQDCFPLLSGLLGVLKAPNTRFFPVHRGLLRLDKQCCLTSFQKISKNRLLFKTHAEAKNLGSGN